MQGLATIEVTLVVETLEETFMQEIAIQTLEVQVAVLEAIKATLVGWVAQQTRAVASDASGHKNMTVATWDYISDHMGGRGGDESFKN